MILGLEKVVGSYEMEPGKFYMAESYDDNSKLMLCIKTGRKVEGLPELKVIRFEPDENPSMFIESLPDYGPVIELPEVHIRVDAPSISGSKASTGLRAGMFFVSGQEALATISTGFREWFTANLTTGEIVESQTYSDWISFSRWLLVIDENGEEITIASFGEK